MTEVSVLVSVSRESALDKFTCNNDENVLGQVQAFQKGFLAEAYAR